MYYFTRDRTKTMGQAWTTFADMDVETLKSVWEQRGRGIKWNELYTLHYDEWCFLIGTREQSLESGGVIITNDSLSMFRFDGR